MGKADGADAYAKPMNDGRIWFCNDTPQRYWLAYLEDALLRGDLKEAEKRANSLYHKANRDKNDLMYTGAILNTWAFTDMNRALQLFESRFIWSVGMWDQKRVYDFYKGAWVMFNQLMKEEEKIELYLPKEFKLYQANNIYNVKELEEFFHGEAEKIAAKFDERNGNNTFAKNLSKAFACGKKYT